MKKRLVTLKEIPPVLHLIHDNAAVSNRPGCGYWGKHFQMLWLNVFVSKHEKYYIIFCLFFRTQDFSGQGGTEPVTLTFVLDIISKVGCAFSIGALCLTLLIFILSS